MLDTASGSPVGAGQTETKMLTILEARNQRGWDSQDHMLDDSKLEELIGRSYKTMAQLRRAVVARESSFARVVYEGPDGMRYEFGTEPSLPGRPNRGARLCAEQKPRACADEDYDRAA